MLRTILTAGAATLALAVTAPALAQHAPAGGGHPGGGPSQTGINASAGSMGPTNASPTGIEHASPNSVLNRTTATPPTTSQPTTSGSQGLQHASPTGVTHASPNSALARGAVAASALPNLTTGLTVQNSSGASIGTVTRIVTGTDGSVRLVIVTSPTGQTYRLVPNTLSMSGTTVTTTTNIGD